MYPVDRRKLASSVYEYVRSLRKAARILNVSHATVARWMRCPFRKMYDASNRMRNSKTLRIANTIRTIIAANPLLSCLKLRSLIAETTSITVSSELVRVALRSIGMTRKKAKFFGQPANLHEKTHAFLEKRDAFVAQGKAFWSLDETSLGRHGAPVYGYAPRGQPLRIKKKSASFTTTSVVAVANDCGRMFRRSRNGSFNTQHFVEFLESVQIPSGDVILLDNVAFHHSAPVHNLAIRKGWELLFVPPYSPWFNPIEEIFSIVKRAWYSGAAPDDAFGRVTASHAHAFFRHALELRGLKTIASDASEHPTCNTS